MSCTGLSRGYVDDGGDRMCLRHGQPGSRVAGRRPLYAQVGVVVLREGNSECPPGLPLASEGAGLFGAWRAQRLQETFLCAAGVSGHLGAHFALLGVPGAFWRGSGARCSPAICDGASLITIPTWLPSGLPAYGRTSWRAGRCSAPLGLLTQRPELRSKPLPRLPGDAFKFSSMGLRVPAASLICQECV